ncbi:DUF2007 domain-containing protein [Pseudotenacibaculum haliotis]|uniref:DUF2007 domain-containing protein n=1 Tax=Pseudotenacibaculum haliotis TaxID=1862138 RepID=A0ABW5LWI1_9FLAO
MKEEHIKVFTGSSIITRRLKSLLEEKNISSLIKSDKIPAYEITNYIDELYVLNIDFEKASPIIEDFKKEIA